VHVYPIKPALKAPVSKCLKLKYDMQLLNAAFKINLRHYTEVGAFAGWFDVHFKGSTAGAYTPPLLSST